MARKTNPAVKTQRKEKKAQIKANLKWVQEHKNQLCNVYGCSNMAWSSDISDHKQYCDCHLPEFVRKNKKEKLEAYLKALQLLGTINGTSVYGNELLLLAPSVMEMMKYSDKFPANKMRYN